MELSTETLPSDFTLEDCKAVEIAEGLPVEPVIRKFLTSLRGLFSEAVGCAWVVIGEEQAETDERTGEPAPNYLSWGNVGSSVTAQELVRLGIHNQTTSHLVFRGQVMDSQDS